MSKRNCTYTNRPASQKKRVIPDKHLTDQHSWVNFAPVSMDTVDYKKDQLPTDLEFACHETFYLLELAKLRVQFLEAKLKQLQEKIGKTVPELEKRNISNQVERDYKKLEHISQSEEEANKLIEKAEKEMDEKLNKFLQDKSKLWE
jgi:hypothetical protein